jgi:nitric oxide reductase large subunit
MAQHKVVSKQHVNQTQDTLDKKARSNTKWLNCAKHSTHNESASACTHANVAAHTNLFLAAGVGGMLISTSAHSLPAHTHTHTHTHNHLTCKLFSMLAMLLGSVEARESSSGRLAS